MFRIGKRYKKYTVEFRQEAARLTETSGKSHAEIARDLGVGVSTLYKWRRIYRPPPERADAKTLEQANRINKALVRENEILKQERKILKTAATFFGKGEKVSGPILQFSEETNILKYR